uniref:Ribosomal protein S14 n=1 Tax=Dictyota dichotoma TaxID=2876 RepID=Q2TU98_DICDH|nr:ribosomal protein S14 [Dictyota dichotoma]AAS79096.1 ribosomal protein S14 [Dictyota dichotoma]
MVKKKIDLIRRRRFKNHEVKQKIFKAIRVNQTLDPAIRWWAQMQGSATTRQGSLSRTHNYCVQTSRSRAVVGFYKLSRLRLLKLASRGLIPGLIKSSW